MPGPMLGLGIGIVSEKDDYLQEGLHLALLASSWYWS
jgi:hypothetical protein